MAEEYLLIGQANKRLRDRFGVGEKTAREWMNNPAFKFPKMVGTPGHRPQYVTAEFEAHIEWFNENIFRRRRRR